MTIKQSRYITAETEAQKKVRVTEVQKIEEDPYIRRSEVQQEINNSTLPVSSRAVKLAIENIELPSLDGYATEEYVNAKVADIKLVNITQELGQSTSKVISQKVVTDELGKKWDIQETVGASNGKVMREGAYGLGSYKNEGFINNGILTPTHFFDSSAEDLPDEWGARGGMGGVVINRGQRPIALTFGNRAELKISYRSASEWTSAYSFYTEANTTIDSNGNLKAASPIIKLFDDRIEYNDSFDEEPKFEKIDTGVYKISNTLGLAKEGWTHNIPLNSNGKGYFRVNIEKLEDGCIVRLFKAKNILDPETFEISEVNGDPVDIAEDQRWIDLRFHEEPEGVEDGGA